MKFFHFLVICVLAMAAMAAPQNNDKKLPTVTGSGGGSRKQGFDVNLDARQTVWESQNKRHSVDASAGYSQHLGGPYGNSRPDYRVGAGYSYHFG